MTTIFLELYLNGRGALSYWLFERTLSMGEFTKRIDYKDVKYGNGRKYKPVVTIYKIHEFEELQINKYVEMKVTTWKKASNKKVKKKLTQKKK